MPQHSPQHDDDSMRTALENQRLTQGAEADDGAATAPSYTSPSGAERRASGAELNECDTQSQPSATELPNKFPNIDHRCGTCRHFLTVAGRVYAKRGWCNRSVLPIRRKRPNGSLEVYELRHEVFPDDSCDEWKAP